MGTVRFVSLAILLIGASYTCAWGSDETNEVEPKKPTVTSSELTSTEDRGRLIADLFQRYDKRNYPANITLNFGVSLLRFDVDEYKNNIHASVWTRQMWYDHRLRWDPAEYGGHKVVRLPSTEVWKPDMTLYNSAPRSDPSDCTDTNVLVYSDGKVLWVPPCNFKANCNLSLDTAPYGEQHCNLKFGSWTFDGFTMDVQFYGGKSNVDMTDFWNTSEWEITGNTGVREEKYYDCCVEPYVSMTYTLNFQRRSSTGTGASGCKNE